MGLLHVIRSSGAHSAIGADRGGARLGSGALPRCLCLLANLAVNVIFERGVLLPQIRDAGSMQISEEPKQEDDWNWNPYQPEQDTFTLMVLLLLRAIKSLCSKLAEQNQDQKDNNHQAEPATAVIAGPIESATTDPAKTAEE